MKLYLTGETASQARHCYFIAGRSVSFLVDCGYQRAYAGDELPHLSLEQIRQANYLFLSHSHENQSGALPRLISRGFTGRVVLTTETARQLSYGLDDPLVLEGLSLPGASFRLPGGLEVTWGRSGHCSGSAWFRFEDGGRSVLFSGDYFDHARVHAFDPIVGQKADLAVLDCDYGMGGANEREAQVDALLGAIAEALADGRPVLLPVPRYGRGVGILTHLCERLPDCDVFADAHFIRELSHMDATALWIRREALIQLDAVYLRPIPESFLALGVYFLCDPQLDTPEGQRLAQRILEVGGRILFTGTTEPGTTASLMRHAGQAHLLRYGVHCTQEDMLRVASMNAFRRIIAYHSDYAPTESPIDI